VYLFILLAGIITEALLVVRVWAQVTSKPIDTGPLRLLFSLTQELAAPFERVTNEAPLQTSGVVDFTVLVAIEGYLIATLALLALCYLVNRSISAFRNRGPKNFRVLPEGPFWQSIRPPHSPASTYYLSAARGQQKR
jgi:hypothetical protein